MRVTKKKRNQRSSNFSWLVAFLMVVAAVLLIGIIAGTLWAFSSSQAWPGVQKNSHKTIQALGRDGSTAIFAELGLLRLATADSPSCTVVLSPFMPYSSTDLAFREELVRKIGVLRSVFTGWFASHTALEIKKMGEEEIKKKLMEMMNSHLVLGQISTLYFEEYTVFE